jgi:hypothetical protein
MVAQFARMYMLRKLIKLPLFAYLRNIYLPVIVVVIVSSILPFYLYLQLTESFVTFIIVSVISVFSVGITTLILGFTKDERNFLYRMTIQKFINRD